MRRELLLFLVVGVLTVLVDFASYRAAAQLDGIGTDAAKALGFVVGTLFAYVANRFLTFGQVEQRPRSGLRFAALYGTTLVVNVAVNAGVLAVLESGTTAVRLAFLLATGTSAALNFLGMKYYVFRATPNGAVS